MKQHKVKKEKLKKKALTMRICCALALGFAPPLWSTACAAEAGASVTVDAGSVKETTVDSSGQISPDDGATYTDVTIQNGGRWRPMDAINSDMPWGDIININKLNVKSGGIIDLSWEENLNPVLSYGTYYFRTLWVTDATLADGAIFRISGAVAVYSGPYACSVWPSASSIALGSDTNPVAGGGTLYVQFGNIVGFNPTKSNSNSLTFGTGDMRFLNIYEKTSGQFKIVGQASYLDAPLNVYKVTPVITTLEQSGAIFGLTNSTLLTANLVDYTIDNTGLLSESAKTAGDMQLAMRNLWRVENANAFNHLDELHRPGARVGEGIWTSVYGGKFTNQGSYGRSVSESYHGLQVGYDKERAGDFYDGKLYTGVFFQKTDADTGVHTGSGSSGSDGFGAYAAWTGHNGHYADIMLRGSRLNNDYYFYSNGGKIDAANHAWAFGLNARYGLHKPLTNGWFWEPHIGLAAGQIDQADYTTSNGLQVTQSKVNVLTGQFGVLAGRSLGEKGNIYAGVAVNHDFLDGGSMQGSYTGETQTIETGANKDTWCELVLGANAKISPTGNFNVSLLRTFGGDVKTNWQVNGGFNWRWGGSASRQKAQNVAQALREVQQEKQQAPIPAASAASTDVGPAQETGPERPAGGTNSGQAAAGKAAAIDQAVQTTGRENRQTAGKSMAAEQAYASQDDSGAAKTTETSISPKTKVSPETTASPGYDLETVVVEARRPEWEDKLSPGTVTVIKPDKYKGEQKTLPDLLKEVPGVHVRYSNGGIGQYTTVSVRGSTASQVGVFVDGVLTNLGGDAAVDISTIPVENVERIEVYRGYIPARFGGTYMGGVINIVTKKPDKAKISASCGQRSWGGYTGSLQIEEPLRKGTLMVGINRDQSEGNFRYTNFDYQKNIASILANDERMVAGFEAGPIDQANIRNYIIAKNQLAFDKRLSATRYRMNNSYKNTDALLKWQDEHWLVKASWKQIDRLLPVSVDRGIYTDVPDADALLDFSNPAVQGNNQRKRQELTAKDILIGRRNTSGNLEWGWNVDYLAKENKYSNPDIGVNSYDALKPLSVWSAYDSQRFGGSLDGSFKAGNHLLDFLVNYSRETMDIRGWRMDEIDSVAYHQWKNKYIQELFNIQLQDTITLNDAGDLWFTPAIRYNSSNVVGFSRFQDAYHLFTHPEEGQRDGKTTWQLALKKKVNDRLTLRSTYGTYYRLLNLYEIAGDGTSILPRPNSMYTNSTGSVYPRPEEGMQWDVGAAWKGRWLKADADLSLTYFSRRSQNLLQLLRYGLDYYCYSNSAKGRASGVELQSNLTWNKWDLDLAATYVKASSSSTDDTPTGAYEWHTYPMTYTPEWEGKLRLTYRPDNKTALFTEINYTGEQFYANCLDGNTYIQTALTTVGLGCRYKLNKNAQLIVGVNDLFDKGPDIKLISTDITNGSNAAYPLQGRTYYATMQYNF